MPHVLPNLMQHCQHGNVGFACASGCAYQQILVAVERCGVDAALDAVQCPVHRQHGIVGFACTGGCAHQQSLVAIGSCEVDVPVDPLQ